MVITCDHPAVIDQILVEQREFFTHHLHSTLPLILIVLSRLDRGIQSATEMLPCLEEGARVLHSFNCPPLYGWYCVLLTWLFFVSIMCIYIISVYFPCTSQLLPVVCSSIIQGMLMLRDVSFSLYLLLVKFIKRNQNYLKLDVSTWKHQVLGNNFGYVWWI